MIKRALISVSDKTGLLEFAARLWAQKFEIVSTGGTAKALRENNIPCIDVQQVTGFPEMLNGRVKTLHPNIFAGIIADQNVAEHMKTIADHKIKAFGLVVVNLYPFAKNPTIENIDVGGPSMLRAAAKNYESVVGVVDPADYEMVICEIEQSGDLDDYQKLKLATKVFYATSGYDRMIADEFQSCLEGGTYPTAGVKH
jgi:phosphoribosylaminoimidazolecarboxamide formyltransferase/IMP cyclohydrolase